MEIFYCENRNIDSVYNLWQTVFEDSKSFCDYYFKEKLIDNKILVAEDNQNIVSMIHLNPYEILFSDCKIHTEYIVGVATSHSYRKRGILKLTMSKAICDMYQSKTEFTFLTTVDENIYSRYNFKYINSYFETEFDRIKVHVQNGCEAVDLTDERLEDFLNYYSKKLKERAHIVRDRAYTERLIKEMKCENGYIKLFYRNKNLKGYILLYINNLDIQIREIMFDSEILKDIVSYIQSIMADKKVKAVHFLDDRLEYIFQSCFNSHTVLKPYVMARLVYMKSFIERIKSTTVFNFNIRIYDSVVKQNNSVFNWSISSNGSIFKKTDRTEDISMDIGTLSQWLLGYHTVNELISMNQIEIKSQNVIQNLNSIITYRDVFINEIV